VERFLDFVRIDFCPPLAPRKTRFTRYIGLAGKAFRGRQIGTLHSNFPARKPIRLSNSLQACVGNFARKSLKIIALSAGFRSQSGPNLQNSLHFPC
jgi:hypothetical protein